MEEGMRVCLLAGDLATALGEAVDRAAVHMSARAYRVIRAVDAYRAGPQRRQLTPAERVLDNFNITVNAPERARLGEEPSRK
jgi:hypothetical protein